MPIYEYACPDCGHQFEHIQKFSDPLLSECPECGVERLKKLVSATSFHLKGSGWYKDHYGLKTESPATDGGSESSASTQSSESSSDSGAKSDSGTESSTSSEGDGGASS